MQTRMMSAANQAIGGGVAPTSSHMHQPYWQVRTQDMVREAVTTAVPTPITMGILTVLLLVPQLLMLPLGWQAGTGYHRPYPTSACTGSRLICATRDSTELPRAAIKGVWEMEVTWCPNHRVTQPDRLHYD